MVASAQVQTDGFLFMKKKRVLVITDKQIYILHASNQTVRFRDGYLNLLGVTASLRIGNRNFIMHFRDRADEEWNCEHRDAILQELAMVYAEVAQAGGSDRIALPVFGIASDRLGDYITSEKDLARKMCKMPTEEYLIQGKLPFGTGRASIAQEIGNEKDFEEDDDDMWDDFVVLEMPVAHAKYNPKYNTTEKIDKAGLSIANDVK